MLKNLVLLVLWFAITPPLLVGTIFLASQKDQQTQVLEPYPQITNQDFNIDNDISGQILASQIEDVRPHLVSRFLQNTPLENYSNLMVEVSDQYAIDYRLIPAIAMKESGGGLNIDQSTHNAWGWENGQTKFDSWESAIETVAKTLKQKYIDRGLITPEEIMAVYAPPQLLTGGKWARDINYFFSQMEIL